MLSKEFYASRREAYGALLENKSISAVFCGEEVIRVNDEAYPFEPYRNFLYLTGYAKPKAVYMGYKTDGTYKDVLFIERPDERKELYEGKMASVDSLKEELGMDDIRYLDKMPEFISRLMFRGDMQYLYVDLCKWGGFDAPEDPAERFAAQMRRKFPYLTVRNTYNELGLLRSHKCGDEIEAHRKACKVTEYGVKSMLRHMKPGMKEYELEAYFDFELKSHGCDHAFTTIAAAGPNSCTLHYSANDSEIRPGDMILFDLGAADGFYCADVSRTYPVDGTFTPRQKQLYEVVLKGLEAGLAISKPGQRKDLIQQESKRVMAEELVKLGVIQEPSEISRYYKHGSGHFIVLYTHDVGDDAAILEEDMVFTLEPGLYFEEEGIGIRIEDTLLVTKDGCEVLSGGIPKTVEEIEAYMAEHNPNVKK